jgi:hypothetical protein
VTLGAAKILQHRIRVGPLLNALFTTSQLFRPLVEEEQGTDSIVAKQRFQSVGQGFTAESYAFAYVGKRLEYSAVKYKKSGNNNKADLKLAHHFAKAHDVLTICGPLLHLFCDG